TSADRRGCRRFDCHGATRHPARARVAAERAEFERAPMNAQARWQKIQSLFEEIVDAEPEERMARLASSCQGDTDLRVSVEALLASYQRTEDPLANAIGAAAVSLLEEHQDRLLGTRIGPYRVMSILGQGGMSTVYRGERDDSQYHQTVAIKVLHHAT